MAKQHIHTNQEGFTIVELMIATLVFSVILMVITYGVIAFTNGYYKGVTSSTTQLTAQGAIDSITKSIQFSAGGTTNTDGSQGFFCAGDKVYVYALGEQYLGDPTVTRGLYQMDRSGACTLPPGPYTGGKEMLGENMRLTSINISDAIVPAGAAPAWSVSLKIAYGDNDLLCDTAVGAAPGGCGQSDAPFAGGALIKADTIVCKSGTIGSQFCSTVSVSSVAQQRIESQ